MMKVSECCGAGADGSIEDGIGIQKNTLYALSVGKRTLKIVEGMTF